MYVLPATARNERGKFSILPPWKLIVTRSILFRADILDSLLIFIVPFSNASGNTKTTSNLFERKGCFSKHLMRGVRAFPHATSLFI
jgi:xanthine/uracil permease